MVVTDCVSHCCSQSGFSSVFSSDWGSSFGGAGLEEPAAEIIKLYIGQCTGRIIAAVPVWLRDWLRVRVRVATVEVDAAGST